MQTHAPEAIVHRWVSSEGTGRNILGIPLSRGHGRPRWMLSYEIQRHLIEKNDPVEVRKLCGLLASDDRDAIEKRVMDILLEYSDTKTQETKPSPAP